MKKTDIIKKTEIIKKTDVIKKFFMSAAGTMAAAAFLFGIEYMPAKAEVLGTAVDTDGNVIYYDVNDVFGTEIQEQTLEELRSNVDEILYCDGFVDADIISEAAKNADEESTDNESADNESRYNDVADNESDATQVTGSDNGGLLLSDSSDSTDAAAYCSTYDDAAKYILAGLNARQTSITVYVTADVYSNNGGLDCPLNMLYHAMDDYDDRPSYEGDAIRWNYESCGYSFYPSPNVTYEGVRYQQIDYHELTYLISASQETELQQMIASALDELGTDEMSSEYDKVKAIHDYICDRVSYDGTLTYYSAYDAMAGQSAVCEGYATLFYRMCKEAGLGVRVIDGNPREDGSSAHAWNIVRIGEYYYDIDTTWDDGTEGKNWNYFLECDADFSGHTRTAKLATSEFYARYPMAKNSYGASTEGFGKNNYSYQYNTITGGTVSTTAIGKAKVLIYYYASDNISDGSLSTTSTDGSNTMSSLAAAYAAGTLSDADYIFIDISSSSSAGVKLVADAFGSSAFTYTYDDTVAPGYLAGDNSISQSYVDMFYYYNLCEQTDGCYTPETIYIDANNKVQYITFGSLTATSVNDNLELYCGVEPVKTADVITFVGNSMSIDDTWNLKYYVQLSDTWKADENALMRFTYGFGTNAKTIDVKVSSLSSDEILESGTSLNGTVLSADTYVFSVGLDAKDIGTTIYAYMVDSDGDCSQVYSYSVKEYAEALLELEDDSDKYADLTDLVKAMLNYGTYSQEYFEYRTNIPANACLDASDKGTVSATRKTAASTWAAAQTAEAGTIIVADDDVRNYLISDLASEKADVTGSIEGLTFGGASLILENTTDIRLYLVIDDFLMSDTAENITVTVDGKDEGTLKNLVTSTVMSGCYYITLSDIEATALGDNYVVTFTDGDDSYSISYSAMSYVYAGLSNVSADDKLVNVMESIYEYYKAAVNMESAS